MVNGGSFGTGGDAASAMLMPETPRRRALSSASIQSSAGNAPSGTTECSTVVGYTCTRLNARAPSRPRVPPTGTLRSCV